MNERLCELMVEAGYAAPELAGRANKLAELILRECAELCYERKLTPSAFTGDDLLEHFGVEE